MRQFIKRLTGLGAADAERLGGLWRDGTTRCAPRGDPYGFQRAMRELGWDDCELKVAEHFVTRLTGLIGAVGDLSADRPPRVLGFPRCGSVHTCFMVCPIDVAFLDGEGGIIAVHVAVPPWRLLRCPAAASVLERLSMSNSCEFVSAWI